MRSASRQFRGSFVAPTKLRCNDTRAPLLRGLIGYRIMSIYSIDYAYRAFVKAAYRYSSHTLDLADA
jgi:hypothetical protein